MHGKADQSHDGKPAGASPPRWARRVHGATNHLVTGFLGGPRVLKFSWVINFQKVGTFPFLAGLMVLYGNFTAPAWVYLALHGSYGISWFIKDMAFPDPGWQVRISFGGALMSFIGVLGWYWVFGWLLISGFAQPSYPLAEPVWFALCITVNVIGTVIMIAADAQKYFTLKAKPGLITDGMFRWVRHPNYLGEILIYTSFALMVWHWLPWVVLAWVWLGVFTPNMIMKEASLSRHPGWAEYRKRTGWLVPGVL